MKRYSKAEREEGAMICALAASNPDMACAYGSVCEAAGIDVASHGASLAFSAWFFCNGRIGGRGPDPVVDAEAEALIRSGWTGVVMP